MLSPPPRFKLGIPQIPLQLFRACIGNTHTLVNKFIFHLTKESTVKFLWVCVLGWLAVAQEARPTQTDIALSGAKETNSLLSVSSSLQYTHPCLIPCGCVWTSGTVAIRLFELASGYLPPQQRDYKPQVVDRSSICHPIGTFPGNRIRLGFTKFT